MIVIGVSLNRHDKLFQFCFLIRIEKFGVCLRMDGTWGGGVGGELPVTVDL